MAFTGKVFTVTGGASGIGLATAKIIAKKGGSVSIADVDAVALEQADAYFSSENVPYMITKVDISKRDQVEAWIKATVDKYGRLDGAANVAGVVGKNHGAEPVSKLDDDEWNRILAINLTGCMYCLRAELNTIEKGGAIVNVASIHGLKGMANYGAYAASKHGVIGLTESAAKENGKDEVRINAVAPGAIYTPMMQKFWDESGRSADAPFDEPSAFQRQGKAEEVANVIVFLLSPESSFVTGSTYSVDGGWL